MKKLVITFFAIAFAMGGFLTFRSMVPINILLSFLYSKQCIVRIDELKRRDRPGSIIIQGTNSQSIQVNIGIVMM